LYLLKETCRLRPEFKLVIMSATINEEIFKNYFEEFSYQHFDIGGKTNYAIDSIFLKDSINDNEYIQKGMDIINKLIDTTQDGDILFFVTSIQETLDFCKNPLNNSYCIEVYSGMDPKQQQLAQEENTSNERKIVVATNVAESSLTISNIKYVVDSGYELFGYYDPDKKSRTLVKKLITQAQAKQRMGRAGRTGPGICYHLYTQNDFDHNMIKYPLPTIKVSNIYGECLKLLSLDTINNVNNLKNVLANFIEPPDEKYVNDSIITLMRLGLIESDKITSIGKLISDIQLDPMQGLALVYAKKLKCEREVSMILAIIDASKGNVNELFILPKSLIEGTDKPQFDYMTKKFLKAKKKFADKYGDHISLLKIFKHYYELRIKNSNKINDWMYKHFLKRDVLDKAFKYFTKIRMIARSRLRNIHIDTSNTNYNLRTRILAALFGGFFINTSFIKKSNRSAIKNSFLDFYDDISGNEIIYGEMITIKNNTNMSIVSRITSNSKKLSEKINITQNDN